jgi:hypothetical protein
MLFECSEERPVMIEEIKTRRLERMVGWNLCPNLCYKILRKQMNVLWSPQEYDFLKENISQSLSSQLHVWADGKQRRYEMNVLVDGRLVGWLFVVLCPAQEYFT